MLDIDFEAEIIEWRGPAPFYFVRIPGEHSTAIKHAARLASYGWGVVPVIASIGDFKFSTSLFPKDGGYLLPLKDAVRRSAEVTVGDRVGIGLWIGPRHGF